MKCGKSSLAPTLARWLGAQSPPAGVAPPKRVLASGPAVLGLAALLMIVSLCGCEVDSAAQKVEIRPNTATLRYGESITLTAYNGYLYTWSLQNESWGILSSRNGMLVTYTSIYDPVSPAVQVVTVASSFSDNSASASSTNSSSTNTAQAYITHIPATSDIVSAVSAP